MWTVGPASTTTTVSSSSNSWGRHHTFWGGIAGAVAKTCTAPLARLTIIFQHFWVVISMVFLVAATTFMLLKLCGRWPSSFNGRRTYWSNKHREPRGIYNVGTCRNSEGGGCYGPLRGMGKKIFVGRLPQEASPDDLRQYFGRFGCIMDVYIPKDPKRTGHRGFGFVTFDDDGVAEHVARQTHEILGHELSNGFDGLIWGQQVKFIFVSLVLL